MTESIAESIAESIVCMTMALPVNIYQIGRYGKGSVIRSKESQGQVVDILTGDKIETNCEKDSKLLLLTRSIGSVTLLPITATISTFGVVCLVGSFVVGVPVIIVGNICKTSKN